MAENRWGTVVQPHLEGAGWRCWFQVGECSIPATNTKLAPAKWMVERVGIRYFLDDLHWLVLVSGSVFILD